MFKSQEQLIAEIHNEFDTAQDRLLDQATTLLNSLQITTESRLEQVAARLSKIGFVNTPTVQKATQLKEKRKEEENLLVTTKEQADLIQYYKFNYPFLKFLTEEELNRICEKYNLIHAPIANYIKEVPEKNLREIEQAQKLKSEDEPETLYRFKLRFQSEKPIEKAFLSALGKSEPIFTRNELHKLLLRYYTKYGANTWVPVDMSGFSSVAFLEITRALPGVPQSSLYDSWEAISKSGLFIAAPKSHFNLQGLSKKSKYGFFNVLRTEVKDPIVFRYVKGGVQVLSKWGLESEDPSLVVEKFN
jgi:hypothetical protein